MTQALAAYNRKDYARSSELYVQAIAAGSDDQTAAYNAACAFALAGNKEQAFSYLSRAVETQAAPVDQLEKDADLASLHADPRWQDTLNASAKATARRRVLWSSPSFETPYKPVLTEDEKIAGLSRLWSETKYNFVDTERLIDVDWDGLYVRYLPKVRAARTTYDYYRVLQELIAKLEDAHSNVYFPEALFDEFLGKPGLHTRMIDGKVIVLDVWDPELRNTGIAPGMEIVRIDGVPVRQFAEREVAPYASVATAQDLEVRLFEYFLLLGPVQKPLRLALQAADGAVSEHTVRRKPAVQRRMFTPTEPAFVHRTLPGNVAYVALNSFEDNTAAAEFIKAFDDIARSSALIIDVRDNGGGSTDVGYRVLATLVATGFLGSSWATRDYKPSYRAWGYANPMYRRPADHVVADPAHHYADDKPVIVLTSARTFSAAEDFVVAFDQTKRGTIIGELTGGSTGIPLSFALPGGGSARVCTKRDSYADGTAFVDVGIKPQIVVHPTVADVRAGKDAVLDAALAHIASRLR